MKIPPVKPIVLFLLCVISVKHLRGQTSENIEFIGALNLPDSSLITYKISFKEVGNHKIEGTSVTDFYGTQKTKSTIKGSINKNSISFFETSNLSTLSKAGANEFCYVHVLNAQIKKKFGKSIIQGKFQGKFDNDSNCLSGNIYLVGTAFLNSSESSNDSSNKAMNTKTIKNLLNKTDENQLGSNDVLNLNWQSDKIIIELWDAAILDDDKVSIFVNGKNVLENFVITHDKKTISIPFNEPKCELKIMAVNEGKSPPNTVNILLKDNSKSTPVVTNLKIGETTSIIIHSIKNK